MPRTMRSPVRDGDIEALTHSIDRTRRCLQRATAGTSDGEEPFCPPASHWAGLAKYGGEKPFALQPSDRCIDGPSTQPLPSPMTNLIANGDSVRSLSQTECGEKDQGFEFAESLGVHIVYVVDDI